MRSAALKSPLFNNSDPDPPMSRPSLFRLLPSLFCWLVLGGPGRPCGTILAQDRLKTMPGYERYQFMSRETTNAFKSGALAVAWTNDGKAFDYRWDGKRYRYDIEARRATELGPGPTNTPAGQTNRVGRRAEARRNQPARPARGRQYTSALSPDGRFKAFHRDWNLWLAPITESASTNGTNITAAGRDTNEVAITTEGNEKRRLKFGTANWVYGEELFQDTAIWWSSNSQKVAFYRFDESRVRDYFLSLDQTRIQSRMDIEPYMKAGSTNPIVDILVHDLKTKNTARVDVRGGRPFDNAIVGHYVYGISWTADSQELLFHRTNRRQNVMEFCAANPETGKTRVIVREEWPQSWTENTPPRRFLKDGRRFIWTSERTGWNNLYLYDLSGRLLSTLTRHPFEVGEVVRVDEPARLIYYLARSGDNPLKLQLHRVGFDGTGGRRLTDPAFHHTISFAPDGKHFTDVAQTHDSPPVTWLRDAEGLLLSEVAKSDVAKFRRLGMKTVELLQFKAADGETDLYGMLHFPSNFNPHRKYPLLVSVYAGPGTTGARETFTMPNLLTEYGFLVATFDSRSASGRGKRFMDAIYLKLGRTEIDDQAAGVKSIRDRRYVDSKRVGMFGTSYGGTVSATSLLRHPEVYRAACASSAVTDYRNYDSIYAERYMWIPQENAAGYDAARVMSYATNLTGRLMLFYGTADDNVHPANTLQLVQALQKAGKSIEVQVGPDQGHAAVNRERMMEFFIENLVLK
jgi:dipeptidyl-peptidase-4